jgi:hypothetical protein
MIGCARREEAGVTDELSARNSTSPTAGAVVDSVLPIAEEILRFRRDLPEVRALGGGARSRDELVGSFLSVVERADTAALEALLLTRPEFGYLYYPHTKYTREPYELSPALLWFQIQNASSDGRGQLFRLFGGRPLHATGYRCEEDPELEGPNRVWSECRVTVAPPDSEPIVLRLFGSILESGGVYKFVSLAADL